MTDITYKHNQVPLTPSIVEELVMQLFRGKVVERRVIVSEVHRHHEARGGKPSNAQTRIGPVRKALRSMADKGLAHRASKGHWRIDLPPGDNGEYSPNSMLDEVLDETFIAPPITPRFAAERMFGAGSGAIYVYYLPAYKERAVARNEKSWACKIGKSDRDPLDRILDQAATALPERPIVDFILLTDHASLIERALHCVLAIRGRRIEGSPGFEWFLTSPEEVLHLINFFDPSLTVNEAPAPETQEQQDSNGTIAPVTPD